MDNTSDEKICCDAYQVVEDGKSFWSMDDFYPKESKSCESVMPCPKEQSAQKSCSKKRPKKPMKHKKSCKRPSSAGTNLCTGNSSQQMAKQAPKNNSECSMKVSSCPPKVNKECVVILPPTERKSNCANFNQESAVEKSSNETVSCPICANMRNQAEQRGSQGSIGSRGSQGSQGSIGSQGGRGSQTLQRLSNASQQSGRRSSTGSFKDGSCHDSAVAKSSCGTVASRVCSCPQTKSSQNTACNNNDDQQISNSSCNDDQQISKPSCNDDQVAKQGNRQVAIKMCLEKPNDNMNCGDGSTTSYPCNIVMDFLKTGENGNQQPKRVKLSFQIYINGDKPQSAQLAIQSVDCCSCSN